MDVDDIRQAILKRLRERGEPVSGPDIRHWARAQLHRNDLDIATSLSALVSDGEIRETKDGYELPPGEGH